jgi:hypothetical protein
MHPDSHAAIWMDSIARKDGAPPNKKAGHRARL